MPYLVTNHCVHCGQRVYSPRVERDCTCAACYQDGHPKGPRLDCPLCEPPTPPHPRPQDLGWEDVPWVGVGEG